MPHERGVVVGAEMGAGDAPGARGDERAQRRRAVGGQDRLRRLDHQLQLDGAALSTAAAARARHRHARPRSPGPAPSSFGIVTTKPLGQPAAGPDQRRHEQIERAQAPRVQLLRQRFDPDADERRQCPLQPSHARPAPPRTARAHPPRRPPDCRSRPRSRSGSPRPARGCSLSTTRPRTMSAKRSSPVAIEFEDARQRRAVRRVLVERRERNRSELGSGVRSKEMRAAVHRVHRLAIAGLARPGAGHDVVHRAEMLEDRL